MIRRLAREAVIFMLLGMTLAAVGGFVHVFYGEAESIKSQRDALKTPCEHLTRPVRPGRYPPEGYDYFGSSLDAPMVTRAECNLVFGTNVPSFRTPTSYAPDFYKRRAAALAESNRIKNLKIDYRRSAIAAALLGMFGFVGGFSSGLLSAGSVCGQGLTMGQGAGSDRMRRMHSLKHLPLKLIQVAVYASGWGVVAFFHMAPASIMLANSTCSTSIALFHCSLSSKSSTAFLMRTRNSSGGRASNSTQSSPCWARNLAARPSVFLTRSGGRLKVVMSSL